jgi:oxygen-independent coproporphyrinogen-3 oxidase
MLSLSQMERVLDAASAHVPLEAAEITTEANPGTVIDEEYLRGLRSLGINRISFGVQSLHDPTLRVLGRIHTAKEAIDTYRQAREAGFERINLDFIFGLPGQTLDQWHWTLDRVAELDVDHFSLYSLILEEGTPLHQQVLRGSVVVPDDDDSAAMYELAMERLAAGGYEQYEISNWARRRGARGALPEQAAHHNVAYWLNADYLAFGAGAHGHVYPRRWHDILGIDQYIATIREGQRPIAEVTELSPEDLHAETMMMGMRLNIGVSFEHFRDRCGLDLRERYGNTTAELLRDGLIEQDEAGIRLSARGRLLANQVFMRFLD